MIKSTLNSIFAAGAFLLLVSCGANSSDTSITVEPSEQVTHVGQSGVVDSDSKLNVYK
ncbi:hypothetical protein [Litoribacter populi]|uniref:hypothetical protein n=1 Tax=Litoribacter populi TaxID=2598460 RepID=UPI001F217178|nr:hypothetical protein [Litoribacter populi]